VKRKLLPTKAAANKKCEAEQEAMKKAELKAAEKAKSAVAPLPELQEDIKKGVEHISSLHCPRLNKDIIVCY
jgi:hypothetical protein